MKSEIFGSACSMSFVKNSNAMEWQCKYSEEATTLVDNHYVEDYMDSCDTKEDMAKKGNGCMEGVRTSWLRAVHLTIKLEEGVEKN